jgi:hypothetical protein
VAIMPLGVGVESIDWTAIPPSTAYLKIEIWTPRPGSPVVATVLGEETVGVYTHFIPEQKATVPCLSSTHWCEYCLTHANRRWQGWLPGLSPRSGKLYLIPITTQAVRSCPVLMNRKTSLRGGTITLKRRGEAVNSPVDATFQSGVPGAALVPAFNVCAQLLRIWGIARMPTVARPAAAGPDHAAAAS